MKTLQNMVYRMKYFSFYIGWPDSKKTNWILLDYKLPALDVKTAIIMNSYAEAIYQNRSFKNKLLASGKLTLPNRKYVHDRYRLILEFEKKRTPEKGRTTHYYKLTRKYHPGYLQNPI